MISVPVCRESGNPATDICTHNDCGRCAFLCNTFCVDCQKHREVHPISKGIWDGLASQIEDIRLKKQPLKIELTLTNLEKELDRMVNLLKKALEDHRASLQVFKSTLTLKPTINAVLANLSNRNYEDVKGRHMFDLVHSLSKDDLYENAGLVESFIRQKNQRMERTVRLLEKNLEDELNLEEDRIKAWNCRLQGRHEESKELFAQVLKKAPNDDWSLWYIGVNERCLGHYNKAVECYSHAIQLNPRDHEYYFSRAYSYFSLGKWHHAVEDCTRAIELNPNIPIYYSYRAQAYEKLGKRDLAQKDIEVKNRLEQ